MANRTLDTHLQQVAIDFFNDEEFHWHGRLLLIQASGSKWITATPDLDVEITELADHRAFFSGTRRCRRGSSGTTTT